MFRLKIQGEDFTNFTNFKLDLAFNKIASGFSFNAFFDETNTRQRTLFRPYSYRKCEIFSPTGRLLLTGTILNHGFAETSNKELTSVGGYSVTGALEDCHISPDKYPLESKGKTVKQIIEDLISDFGISLGAFNVGAFGGSIIYLDSQAAIQKTANEVIEKSTSTPTKTIKTYINEICAQRNLILTHNEKGQLVVTRVSASEASVRTLTVGDYTKIALGCNGQKMHDNITVMRQASKENANATEESIRNPFIVEFRTDITTTNKFIPNHRPFMVIQKSGEDSTASNAAQNALANELKNITFTIQVPKWYWAKNQMILPRTIITLPKLPTLHLYNKTKVFIESVSYTGTTTEQVATITAVLPEVYNGEIPKNIFI